MRKPDNSEAIPPVAEGGSQSGLKLEMLGLSWTS